MKVLLAPLLLIAAAPALADVVPTATPTEKPDDKDKVICKRQVVVGSRLPGPRVCQTKAQWSSNDRDAQDAARKAQANRRTIDP